MKIFKLGCASRNALVVAIKYADPKHLIWWERIQLLGEMLSDDVLFLRLNCALFELADTVREANFKIVDRLHLCAERVDGAHQRKLGHIKNRQ